jgi:6-phosphogluconate dehydrogenase
MQLGMIGLGRMGGNIVRRLMRNQHDCVVFDADPQAVAQIHKEGAHSATSIKNLVNQLAKPRAVWVMLPAGEITENTITELATHLEDGDVIIDGGNTNFKDDVRRAQTLQVKGIAYIDVGTSGGVWGLERGYCMMIGGDREAVTRLDPIFRTLAPGIGTIELTHGRDPAQSTAEQGYLYTGPAGSGHFVKMVHNGIEYGLMQAYAEGLDILKGVSLEIIPAERRYDLNLADITELWRRGSVVSSWLLDLSAIALAEDPELTIKACLMPTIFANLDSNASEFGPEVNQKSKLALTANSISSTPKIFPVTGIAVSPGVNFCSGCLLLYSLLTKFEMD